MLDIIGVKNEFYTVSAFSKYEIAQKPQKEVFTLQGLGQMNNT